jgi:hypothetical protein
MVRGVRTSRTLDGKVVLVGVAGRTLTLVCGLRPPILLKLEDPVGLAMDADDDMEEALEWCCCWCIERIEDTEDEVDFRPLSPELRR